MGGVGVIPPLTSEEILAARMPHLWPAHPDPGRSTPPQHLPADEAVDGAADAADLRCAEQRHELRPARGLDRGAAGAGADEQRIQRGRKRRSFASRIRELAGDDPEGSVERGLAAGPGPAPDAERTRIGLDYLRRNSLPGCACSCST
jgi:hypothetical protein